MPTIQEMTMNTNTAVNRFRTIIATALLGAVASSCIVLPAVAVSSDLPQATVKYTDLNIASPEGAAVLYARIRRAAEKACSKADGDVDTYGERQVCINKAILGAVTKVNAPALSAIVAARYRKPLPVVLAEAGAP
jgi:UrcA family protein